MKAKFGTISHGTLRTEDLVRAFSLELAYISNADRSDAESALLVKAEDWLDASDDTSVLADEPETIEAGSELVSDLTDALNERAPAYGYFGALEGDGSDFGFWLSEDWQQNAEDDGVTFVSDLSELPDTFRGEACVVNDHGNATLYATGEAGTLVEVWSVV